MREFANIERWQEVGFKGTRDDALSGRSILDGDAASKKIRS